MDTVSKCQHKVPAEEIEPPPPVPLDGFIEPKELENILKAQNDSWENEAWTLKWFCWFVSFLKKEQAAVL